jgi:D-alanine-D-alanine ligase
MTHVPVPLETHVRPGDQGATLPSVFPALLKPNYGDSSQGITKDAVVHNEKALLDYWTWRSRGVRCSCRNTSPGPKLTLVNNPDQGRREKHLEVDFALDRAPGILGYDRSGSESLLDADGYQEAASRVQQQL